MPDEDIDAMVAALRRLIDDPAVELVPPGGGRSVPPPSGIQTEMFRALENAQQKLFPDAATLPVLLTGATDMAPLRARGVQAYGLDPPASIGETTGVHGNDERISVEAVRVFVQFVYEAVTAVAAANRPACLPSLVDLFWKARQQSSAGDIGLASLGVSNCDDRRCEQHVLPHEGKEC